MKTAIKLLSPAALAMLLLMPINQASATDASPSAKLRLKTSVTEVNGVREIETGNFEKGIRKSIASLNKLIAPSKRKPLLDNLCVAYTSLNDMQQAQYYCDAAVNTSKPSAISYNNRAVMHFVAGNIEASVEDIDAANDLGNFKSLVRHNEVIITQQSLLSKR